jgi:polysaccharide deacetylase family protein (PEP-CTERM system associated)
MSGETAQTLQADKTIASWHLRPLFQQREARCSALTVDVEDYFQVEAFFDNIDRESWDSLECRVERNIDIILQLLAQTNSRATFFTLGWIAKRYPAMIRSIVAQGHELASHGSDHRRADQQTRAEFSLDIARAKSTLEDIGGAEVKGYRAPSFSILKGNLWALEQIAKVGYAYSSSIYPVHHDNYGIPEAPRFAFHPFENDSFVEVPVTSFRFAGRNWPCGGGGYFRLLPYGINSAALRYVNRREGRPCVFYFHPWELDVDQPRIDGVGLKSKFRHYLNLGRMRPRLSRLMESFAWRRMDETFLLSDIAISP